MDTATKAPAPQATEHYDASYFAWQKDLGVFFATTNRRKFAPHITSADRVLDFGCGGGYLLAGLACLERRGVEVNPVARAEAARNGVMAVASTAEIPDGWATVIISNSCLEHVESPITELRALYPKLRAGGTLVVAVPHETDQWAYRPNDINQHLHTWSPMALGNLVTVAGYVVDRVWVEKGIAPPRYARQVYALLGETGYVAVARGYRLLRRLLSPVWPLDIASTVVVVAHRQT